VNDATAFYERTGEQTFVAATATRLSYAPAHSAMKRQRTWLRLTYALDITAY